MKPKATAETQTIEAGYSPIKRPSVVSITIPSPWEIPQDSHDEESPRELQTERIINFSSNNFDKDSPKKRAGGEPIL